MKRQNNMAVTGFIKKQAIRVAQLSILLLLFFMLMPSSSFAQQRFPRPEFETGYVQPSPETPEPRSLSLEYVDVAVLLAVMALVTWFLMKKRSRRGIFWTSVFTLIYFGFYRNGCICSVGSVQNVALSLFNTGYSVSITVLAFFLLPLIFSLFYGRVFCAGACPLGVIQDLIILKPITLPSWLQKTLGIFPFVYLGLAILFAVTGTDFIICRYDPFVGIFRMGAEFTMIVLGIGMLLIGLFVARPYCRFFCPYGALLKVTSFFARRHMTITPAECIQCRLCATSCPFDAIDFPDDTNNPPDKEKNLRRFILYLVLIPVWVGAGGFALSSAHIFLSRAHPDVFLANLLVSQPELVNDLENIDIQTFLASGKPLETLVEEAGVIQQQFRKGGWILGGFIGFVIGMTLLNQVVFRRKTDYEPHKGNCYSCGRCMKYCPVIKKN